MEVSSCSRKSCSPRPSSVWLRWALLLVLSFGASPSSWADSSFDAQLQEAIKPLLTLPDEQRKQVAAVLKLYRTELDGLRKESSALTDQVKSFRLEVSGLKIDLALTSTQLTELSTLLSEERAARAKELADVKAEALYWQIWAGAGGAIVGALLTALAFLLH